MTDALLIIDTQVNMFDGATTPTGVPVHDADALLGRLETLAARARAAGAPVVYVQHCGGPGEPDEPGAPAWAIHPRVAPQPGDLVVQKRTPDGFEATELQRVLADLAVDHLILCGMQSELCIDATARHAAELGYGVTVVADAHSTFDGEQPAPALIDQVNQKLGAVATIALADTILQP
jgi:nicotinamidase-related amidase